MAAFVGIPAQAVLGGITVLTGLNPWTVAAHFLLSMAILAITTTLAARAYQPPGPARVIVNPSLVTLIRVLVGVTAAVLALGTVVTGSGPHAGDVRRAPHRLRPGDGQPAARGRGHAAGRPHRRDPALAARVEGAAGGDPGGGRVCWPSSWPRA